MAEMKLKPCSCGMAPKVGESEYSRVYMARIECSCGKRGDTAMYTKPADRDKMIQAAADGWNLAE